MSRIRTLLGTAVLLLAAWSGAQSPPPLALVGGKVVVRSGQTVENATVLVRDGKVVSVTAAGPVPDGYTRVDVTGKTVYPGFIDGYSTRGLQLPELAEQAARPATDTAPATMWEANRKGIRSDLQASKLLNLASGLGDAHRSGLTAALLSPGNGTLRGTASLVLLADGPAEQLVVLPSVASEISFRSGPGTGYPGSLMGVIALLRQTLYDAQRYALLKRRGGADFKADPVFEGLVALAERTMPALFLADTEREIDRALNIADEFDLPLMIASGREAYRWADRLKQTKTPVVATADVGAEPRRTPAENDPTPAAVLEERYQAWRERALNTTVLAREGVPFALSTEGDNVRDFLSNVRALIALGLPKDAALDAMTLGAATILGVSDRLGSLEAGKIANLTVMSGDFADAASRVESVVVGGRQIPVEGGN